MEANNLMNKIKEMCIQHGDRSIVYHPIYSLYAGTELEIYRLDDFFIQLMYVKGYESLDAGLRRGDAIDLIHQIDFEFDPVFYARRGKVKKKEPESPWLSFFSKLYAKKMKSKNTD